MLNRLIMKTIYLMLTLLFCVSHAKPEEVAVIHTKYGNLVMRFYPKVAPMHVESFKKHAKTGYFNGTLFHRVIPSFVIQGGDPYTKDKGREFYGTGGHAANYYGVGDKSKPESWRVPQEFNSVKHDKGVLSMARAQSVDSAGSQFFICLGSVPSLDEKYTVFGRLVEGEDVLDKIGQESTDDADRPLTDVSMTVTIETRDFGKES